MGHTFSTCDCIDYDTFEDNVRIRRMEKEIKEERISELSKKKFYSLSDDEKEYDENENQVMNESSDIEEYEVKNNIVETQVETEVDDIVETNEDENQEIRVQVIDEYKTTEEDEDDIVEANEVETEIEELETQETETEIVEVETQVIRVNYESPAINHINELINYLQYLPTYENEDQQLP